MGHGPQGQPISSPSRRNLFPYLIPLREETPLPASFGGGWWGGRGLGWIHAQDGCLTGCVVIGVPWWQVVVWWEPVQIWVSFFQTQTVIHTVQSSPGRPFPVSRVAAPPHPLSPGTELSSPRDRKEAMEQGGRGYLGVGPLLKRRE